MSYILLTKKVSNEWISKLEEFGEVVEVSDNEPELFDKYLRSTKAVLLSTSYNLDEKTLNKAESLKIVSRTGVGYDNVDIDIATKQNIAILNTAGANAISVAEHTLMLMLAIAKNVVYFDQNLRSGNFAVRRSGKAVDLDNKTLGLVGLGKIGLMVAEKAKVALNMKVLAYDPYLKDPVEGIEMKDSIEEIFSNSDIVSLHIPKTDATTNLVNNKLLSIMKPEAYLINTARGGIIDENDLYKALLENKIAGAALDVFEQEPIQLDNKLLTCSNVILTPHSAALTKECSKRILEDSLQNMYNVLKHNDYTSLVNTKILKEEEKV